MARSLIFCERKSCPEVVLKSTKLSVTPSIFVHHGVCRCRPPSLLALLPPPRRFRRARHQLSRRPLLDHQYDSGLRHGSDPRALPVRRLAHPDANLCRVRGGQRRRVAPALPRRGGGPGQRRSPAPRRVLTAAARAPARGGSLGGAGGVTSLLHHAEHIQRRRLGAGR